MRCACSSSSAGKEAAYPDDAGAGVRASDGTELAALDLQLRKVRLQLALHIRRAVRGIDVHHAEPFESPQSNDQLDEPPQGARQRPHTLDRMHGAILHAEDRLDAEQRARESLGATNPTTALQELERADHDEDP